MQVDLIQITTRDGVRLDGMFQPSLIASQIPFDACCLVHGTGGNFYSSSLFDALGEKLLSLGCGVLRINTRGHDGISNAVTAQGGRRLGAAYEMVDDCRHDLVGWIDWLKSKTGPRIGLIGHSLGAVKSIYTLALEKDLGLAGLAAISPPRLSYEWFCASPEGSRFLESYQKADALVNSGQGSALIEVKLPLPFVITAAGYVEKYGPEERYNYLKWLPRVSCPTLLTLGSIEAENNMAFRNIPEAIEEISKTRPMKLLTQVVLPGADHFYSGVRHLLGDELVRWMTTFHFHE